MIFGIRVLLGVHLDVPKLETIVYTLRNAALSMKWITRSQPTSLEEHGLIIIW